MVSDYRALFAEDGEDGWDFPATPPIVTATSPEELADRAVIAGLVPEHARGRIVSAALDAQARQVVRGTNLERCRYHLAPAPAVPGEPASVNILYGPPWQREEGE